MKWNRGTAAGVGLALAGILLPSAALVDTSVPYLAQGALLFRAGLVALGAAIAWLARLEVWNQPAERTRWAPPPLLWAILAAAAALRLYRLGEGLWFDEIATHIKYMELPLGKMISTYGSENQHFLFSILARLSILTFGDTAWAFRLPAVVFGVASVWSLYLMAREVGTEREALFASALFAFSYHHIWFSQNARGYSGLLFWTLLASWLLLRALREDRAQIWVGYAAAAALGVFTQATIVFVLVGHALIAGYYLVRRRQVVGPALGFGMGALLTFQLHALALPQVFLDVKKTVSVVNEWKRPLWALAELASGLQVNFAGGVAAVGAVALFGAGMASFLRRRPEVVALLLLPPALGASVVLAMGHHIWPRFFYFAFGFAALIVIRGATVLGDWAARLARQPGRSGLVSGACCFGLIAVSAASVPFAYGPKQDFGGAHDFVEANRTVGDAVVTADLASYVYSRYYRKSEWTAVESAAQLAAVRARSRRTWLIYTLEPVLAAEQAEVYGVVKRDFRVVKRFGGTLKNGAVVVCVAGE
ncbi:MAG: glycosyltransferase family 39 protein [Acidobacteria bacterium]|nr:glycosyltransferase family 39 protein [Acidobacteriota bacterium]